MHTGFAALQWVMDIYALALAALLLGAGSLADRIGRRRVYLGGLVVFAAASLACGLATGPAALIAFRAVQGLGGAAMFATTMALLSSAYQGRDRGIAFGVWGAVNGAAAAAGPIIGGLLTEHFGWRWIFYINLPVCAVAVYVTLKAVADSATPTPRASTCPAWRPSPPGRGWVTYAPDPPGENGWTSAATLGLLGVGRGRLRRLRPRRTAHRTPDAGPVAVPQQHLRRCHGRRAAAVRAAFSYLMYVSLWLQSVEGMSPVGAGLVVVPLSLASFLVSALAGRLLHGAPARLTIGGGLALIGAGALLQAWMLDAGDGWQALVRAW
ncbi:MFS transporter [Streptomyces cirratus]